MLLPLVFILITNVVLVVNAQQLEFWLTDPDANILFQQQPSISPNTDHHVVNDIINLNDSAKYQTIDSLVMH